MKQIMVIAFLLSIAHFSTQAQDIGGGFKVGLNNSKIYGASEVGADGSDLEEFKFLTGFHVGGLVQLKMSNRYGFQAEVLYMQRGVNYSYEGAGFQTYIASNNAIFNTTGTRKVLLNVTNGYINIPLSAYVNVTKGLSIGVGAYMDILVNSEAIGETSYIGLTSNGSNVYDPNNTGNSNPDNDDLIITNYQYNYGKNEAGAAVGEETMSVLVGSESVSIPSSEGAYYNWATKDGHFYNAVDFGVSGSAGWRFGNGLRFDLRANYGLTDVTNNYYDLSKSEHDASFKGVQRSDIDKNLTISLSVGFGF